MQEELELPSKPENVIGLRAVLHRMKFLERGVKEEDIRYIGVFGAQGWLQKMYKKQGFTNDFENFKTVPIYPSGAYMEKFSLIVDKVAGIEIKMENGEEIVKKYLELVKDYPEDHFFSSYKLMCELMERESFHKLEKIISENPIFNKIKFLESHIVDNEE